MDTISYEDFRALVARRARTLLAVTSRYVQFRCDGRPPTRPLLGELMSHSTQLEELIDAYGARDNRRWSPFRSLVAAIKLFSDVSYELLHIRHSVKLYQLLPIGQDVAAATDRTLAFTTEVLHKAALKILRLADELGLPIPAEGPAEGAYEELLPPGRLPHDRPARQIHDVGGTVTNLATAFLDLAAQSELVHVADNAKPEQYADYVPDPICEENLRYLQQRFHNLQSLYDTYVGGSRTASVDADLPFLRGHISMVYHLLKAATAFAHYYQRHVISHHGDQPGLKEPLVSPEELLAALMEYSIAYAGRYVSSAESLCRLMLKRYAEVGRVTVPVPRYRGFHVRPATLVAMIVRHYGSEVRMELEDGSCDAGDALEIGRANEMINAQKRRWLADAVAELDFFHELPPDADFEQTVHRVVGALAEQGKVVIYEQPLRLPPRRATSEGGIQERVIEELKRLQGLGKIDMHVELSVTFVGDKRALADIKLLADNGYGEDNLGNNIPLPRELAYLRR